MTAANEAYVTGKQETYQEETYARQIACKRKQWAFNATTEPDGNFVRNRTTSKNDTRSLTGNILRQ